MALDISLEITSITADRESGILTDNTVYGTGGNPARADVGVFVVGQKMKFDSTIDSTLTVTGNHSDPETDSTWTFNIPKDGWFRFLFVAPEDYAGGTTYALYDAVFDPTTNNVYRSLQSGNVGNSLGNTSFWELIADPAQLALNSGEANESTNLASQVYQVGLFPNSEYAYASQIAIASQEGGDAEREQNVTLYELLAVFVDGGYIRDDRSEFSQLEKLARRIESVAVQAGLL
jgi:hypothetical protein